MSTAPTPALPSPALPIPALSASGRRLPVLRNPGPGRSGVTNAALITAALVLGAALATIMATPHTAPQAPHTTWNAIAEHNILIATIAMLGGTYVARPLILLSSFWLGMAAVTSARLVGLERTARLLLPHAPLEMTAWWATLMAADLTWNLLCSTVAQRRLSPHILSRLTMRMAVTVLIYLLAAVCEYAEIITNWKG